MMHAEEIGKKYTSYRYGYSAEWKVCNVPGCIFQYSLKCYPPFPWACNTEVLTYQLLLFLRVDSV